MALNEGNNPEKFGIQTGRGVPMTSGLARDCPICGGKPRGVQFPYGTRFNGHAFRYLKCRSCATVFVDPLPDDATFKKMYAKADYHDRHYEDVDQAAYHDSVEFLARHTRAGSRILDYGCGTGAFLEACVERGYVGVGVDFDADAARETARRTQCICTCVLDFAAATDESTFDAIHLGDVLEHLPEPLTTISCLIERLRVGGVLYVEGPIEVNASPVYWAARLFGGLKRMVNPQLAGSHAPTHLLLTDAASQKNFFLRLGGIVQMVDWKVEETGWPYSEGGEVKRMLARVARLLGGRRFFGVTFGNRFKAVLLKREIPGFQA